MTNKVPVAVSQVFNKWHLRLGNLRLDKALGPAANYYFHFVL